MSTSPESPPLGLQSYVDTQRERINAALEGYLPAAETEPATLHAAMRHSTFAGGKRLRPVLCIAAAEACGGEGESTMALACALECLHTFSLIHDDLPCMDDDDFRRGHPTCHKVYGDAIAVLAGDALQALAFELAASFEGNDQHGSSSACRELAVASGSLKIIAGQVMDLEAEGGKPVDAEQLRRIHDRKTAALLETSCRFGGISAGANGEQMAALSQFGRALGLAFQVIDDILDTTQSTETLGKTAGKDEAAGKATYPALIGLEASRAEAARLTAEAKSALEIFDSSGDMLRAAADYLLDREY